jgi:hypothetical protein
MRPAPFRWTADTVAAADGTASAEITPPGNVDGVVLLANVNATPQQPQPSGIAYVDGMQRDVTDGAAPDSSDTRIVLRSGSVYRFDWSGCAPGAKCKLILTGVQYAAGTAPWE